MNRKNIGLVLIGDVISKVPILCLEFILAKILDTTNYALWIAFSLLLRASPYAHLGIISYYNKYFPMECGRNNGQEADIVQYKSVQLVLLVSFTFFLFFILASNFNQLSRALEVPPQFIVILSVIYPLTVLYATAQAIARNREKFNDYVIGLQIYSWSFCLLSSVLGYFWSTYGAIIGASVSLALAFTYYAFRGYFRFRIFGLEECLLVFKKGAAPFFLTLSAFLMQSSDRAAYVIVGDENYLVGFGFAFLFYQLNIVAIGVFGKAVVPYYLRKAASENDFESKILHKVSDLFIFLYLLMSLVFLFFGDNFIVALYPKYERYHDVVFVYIAIGFYFSYSQIFFPKFLASHKEWRIIGVLLGFSFINVCLLILVANKDVEFTDLSLVSLLVNFAFSILVSIWYQFMHGTTMFKLTAEVIRLTFPIFIVFNFTWGW